MAKKIINLEKKVEQLDMSNKQMTTERTVSKIEYQVIK